MQSGEMDDGERARFEAWHRADSANKREYQALQHVWDTAAKIPADRLWALAEDNSPRGRRRHPSRRTNRWHYAGAAFACLIVLGVAAGAYQWQQAQPVFTAVIDTALGERRNVTLPDRSSIDVNTQTRVQIRYYKDRRTVVLTSGEASFNVDPDAARPFIVNAGKASVRVTGTRFNVRRNGDGASVAVLSGTVEVAGSVVPAEPATPLAAGQSVEVDSLGRAGNSQRSDVAALTAWREGRLIFDDASLADVVREVARYCQRSIRLAGPEVAQLRLSSTFNLNNTDALLDALPRILPVKVRTLPDGSSEIYRP